MSLRVDSLTVQFGGLTALHNVSLSVRRDELLCLVGPTNAGKTTLLKAIAGVCRPSVGQIFIAERDVTLLPARDRKVSVVFQTDALFPDRTGFDNIAFALAVAGAGSSAIARRVQEVATLLRIQHLLERYPQTFSGGERKRVAIGRAIAAPSDILMLDEPLSSLDAPLRTALRLELKKLRSELGACVVYVTHDHLEAMSLADRIAVLHEGRIQQVGTPDEIYRAPANRLVASFFGSPPMNLLRARLVRCTQGGELIGQGFRVLAPDLRSLSGRLPASRVLELGLPAEDLRVADTPSEATPFSARVLGVEPLGRKRIVHLMLGDAAMRAVVRPDHPVQSAGEAWIGFTPSPENLVDADTGLFLR